MNPGGEIGSLRDLDFPRASGDEPDLNPHNEVSPRFSPREWG